MKYAFIQSHRHVWPISVQCRVLEVSVAEPDKVWAGDITYIATDEGWLFLAVMIDLFRRQVVDGPLRAGMTRDIVIDALGMVWFKRHPAKQTGRIFHSDRTHYGITSSMRRKGNCWDNVCSERLSGSLQVERLHGQRFETRRQAKDEAIAWLLWYNQTRPHSTLAYVSAMRFAQDWFAAQATQANL